MTDDAKKDKKEKQGPRRPWRDNIEAVTMAIIMAVMLKYFIIEAYKIPTGSMQPTLMGNSTLEIEDRILVDKLSYHFRDPERFEVVIFKYPLDRSKNFIKRIIGMPNEKLRILGGDLWTSPRDAEQWTVLRKPKNVQEDMWKPLIDRGGNRQTWKANNAASKWKVSDHEIAARGDGAVVYPGTLDSVRDNYKDGYPQKMAAKMNPRQGGNHDVGDLRVRGEVKALAGMNELICTFREGDLDYRMVIPGPAASADAKPRIEARQPVPGGSIQDLTLITEEAEAAFRLEAGDETEFSAHNLDNQLVLEIEGEIVAALEIVPAQGPSTVSLGLTGEGADFTELQVYRDIYYSGERVKFTQWDIPEESYVMLGDNTQDSSDGREWQFSVFELTPEDIGEEVDGVAFASESADGAGDTPSNGHGGESGGRIVLRGNHRGNNENPHYVPGGPRPEVWFRDEWGELYHWEKHAAIVHTFEEAPFVPRHLITGRAVLVFWPMKRELDVYRLKWIH